LFLNSSVTTEHITTLAQITEALGDGDIMEVLLPQLDFHCSSVSAAVYNHGTPAPTVVGP